MSRLTVLVGPCIALAGSAEEVTMPFTTRTVTRGFTGKARDPRLPPGQYDTGDSWPVLTAEPTPTISTRDWSLSIDGLVEQPTSWTWDEIRALPPSTFHGDIHCVTSWS